MAASTTQSELVFELEGGDIQVNEGQLGQVVQTSSGANLVLTPGANFDKLYHRYLINATADINVTLPNINTASIFTANLVQLGWTAFIKNTGTGIITLLEASTTTSVGTITGGQYKIITAQTDGGVGADTWADIGFVPKFQEVYDAGTVAADSIITLDSTKGGMVIRDDAIGSSLFTVQDNAGTTDYFDLTASACVISVNTTIVGDLDVQGTTTSIDSETVNIADNHLYLNKDYTTTTAQTGGLVVNYLPTAVTTTADTGGFDTVLTVQVVSEVGFVTGDFIQVSGADNIANDGIYEIDTVAVGEITIRGTTGTVNLEDFTQTEFTVDGTDTGAVITKVNLSILRCGAGGGANNGAWEVSLGENTGVGGLTFVELLREDNATLQFTYDASISASENGNIILDGTSGTPANNGVSILDGTTTLGTNNNLFEVTNNAGSTEYLAVRTVGIKVDGNSFSLNSTNHHNASRYQTFNKNYTTTTGVTGGIIINSLPVTSTTSDTGGFDTTTTVQVVSSAGFTAGDIILVAGTDNLNNEGFYEIGSVAAGEITITGSPAAGIADLVKSSFVIDITDTGATITHVNISVIRSDTSGNWETGYGNNNTLTFTAIAGNTTLQNAYDNGGAGTGGRIIVNSASEGPITIEGTAANPVQTIFQVQNTAGGTNYFAIKNITGASVSPALQALGGSATTIGSIAIGIGSGAGGGTDNIAIGNGASVTLGGNSIAIGTGATASSDNAFAICNGATASGGNSISIGKDSTSSGIGSITIGNTSTDNALAAGDNSIAIGNGAQVTGAGAVGASSIAIGNRSKVSIAGGILLSTLGDYTNTVANRTVFGCSNGWRFINSTTPDVGPNLLLDMGSASTNATPSTTPVYALSTVSDTLYHIHYTVIGARETGGSIGDSWTYNGQVRAKNIGGTLTKTPNTKIQTEDDKAANITIDVSGTTLNFNVLGVAGYTIDWTAYVWITSKTFASV